MWFLIGIFLPKMKLFLMGLKGNLDAVPFNNDISPVVADHCCAVNKLNRLPLPEPSLLKGEPLRFPNWKMAFNTLIIQASVSDGEKLFYLGKYLAGDALSCVESLFMMPPEAFPKAMGMLETRYGNPYHIADAFRSRLECWPRILHNDPNALRKFSDFLQQCSAALDIYSNLSILNDERQNRLFVGKLLDWLVNRWIRQVADYKKKNNAIVQISISI